VIAPISRNAGADVTIRLFNASQGLTNEDLEAARHWFRALNKPTREKL